MGTGRSPDQYRRAIVKKPEGVVKLERAARSTGRGEEHKEQKDEDGSSGEEELLVRGELIRSHLN